MKEKGFDFIKVEKHGEAQAWVAIRSLGMETRHI